MYIQLNSQIICYEKTGEGSPVILIHGNREDHHIFDTLANELSKYHTVIAMDLRGHGESATPKEYHYSDMAEDVINLINALELDHPCLLGFSDGAIVSLLVAIKRSSLISGIICCGANLSPAGINRRDLKEMKKEYKKTQDPRVLMMLQEPNIDPNEFRHICVPAFIFAGERDIIKESETETIADNIPNAVLYILPGENHYSYIVDSSAIIRYIYNFIR